MLTTESDLCVAHSLMDSLKRVTNLVGFTLSKIDEIDSEIPSSTTFQQILLRTTRTELVAQLNEQRAVQDRISRRLSEMLA